MSMALVFPGQGAQYVGMSSGLGVQLPAARKLLEEADRILGFSLSKIIAEGPEAELTRTDISQPAILVASLMSYEALKARQQTVFTAVAGLSLGEYTALVVAGALSFADAVRLVHVRGQAMQAAADITAGGMVALIGADEKSAQMLCDACIPTADGSNEILQIANLNSPGQVVISGAAGACERALAQAKDHGIKRAIALKVAGAFHSALMAPAAERLRVVLAQTRFLPPSVPVFTNVTAQAVTNAEKFPELLIAQLTKPVRWADSVMAMNAAGVDSFMELGPGKTLCGMITRTIPGVQTRNLDTAADAQTF